MEYGDGHLTATNNPSQTASYANKTSSVDIRNENLVRTVSSSNLISMAITTQYLEKSFPMLRLIISIPIATIRKGNGGLSLLIRIWKRSGVHLNLHFD